MAVGCSELSSPVSLSLSHNAVLGGGPGRGGSWFLIFGEVSQEEMDGGCG